MVELDPDLGEHPLHQHGSQGPAVVGGSTEVLGGMEVRDRRGVDQHRMRSHPAHCDPDGVRSASGDGSDDRDDRPVHRCASGPIRGQSAPDRECDRGDESSGDPVRAFDGVLERQVGSASITCDRHDGVEREQAGEQLALGIADHHGATDGRGVANRPRALTTRRLPEDRGEGVGVDDILDPGRGSDPGDSGNDVDPVEREGLEVHDPDR